jgi:iron complex outermembrane recepter protein
MCRRTHFSAPRLAAFGLAVLLAPQVLLAEWDYDPLAWLRRAQYESPPEVQFQLVSMQPPGLAPAQPVDAPAGTGTLMADYFASLPSLVPDLEFQPERSPSPLIETTDRAQRSVNPNPDLAQTLAQSSLMQTVGAQRRSPVANEPYVRGFRGGQLYTAADGAYWLPVRQDLDSMISKIEPSLIQDVTVIPGPYGLRYGPGFGFLAITTQDAIARGMYENGFEAHHRSSVNTRTNGGQLLASETVWGGNEDYGFIINYGMRTGADYRAGGGSRIPSSYKNQTFLGQFGMMLYDDAKLEFRYGRLDGVRNEFAAQFFDIDLLVSDSFTLSFVDEHPYEDAATRADLWYNTSRFRGTTNLSSKRGTDFPVLVRVERALETELGAPIDIGPATNATGDTTSTGARLLKTMGPEDSLQFTVGSDFRFVEQRIAEQYFMTNLNTGNSIFDPSPLETNMPQSRMVNPGLFTELSIPLFGFTNFAFGGRVDWTHTEADPYRPDGNLAGREQSRENVLYGFYAVNDLQLTDAWASRVGIGHAQRPPTLIERYADGLFMGVIQSGFSRVIGSPELSPERNWQMDWTLTAEYEDARGRASFFHAWILDYITMEANVIADPAGARLLRYVNTGLATLTGFELYGEYDVAPWLTLFGASRYVDGRDRDIRQPLPNILPLEGRVGFRLREATNDAWALETGVRIVNHQDQVASLRAAGVDEIVPLELPTSGFTTVYLRGYYAVSTNLTLIGGVENLFDQRYLEHVDLRLPADANFRLTEVLAPGITPYFGVEWTR